HLRTVPEDAEGDRAPHTLDLEPEGALRIGRGPRQRRLAAPVGAPCLDLRAGNGAAGRRAHEPAPDRRHRPPIPLDLVAISRAPGAAAVVPASACRSISLRT